jgi:nitric oxide reductase NorE protein
LTARRADVAVPNDPNAVAQSDPAPHLPGEPGVWVFIFGDMMAFAVMFGAYVHEQRRSLESFSAGQQTLDLPIGTINTVLLLTGSLIVVLAVRAARGGAPRATWMFWLGLACGAGFVANKIFEFSALIAYGHTPTSGMYFVYFFLMAGGHLVHVIAGMAVLAHLAVAVRQPGVTDKVLRRVENGASYWHLVDLLWIVLFSLLYLVR